MSAQVLSLHIPASTAKAFQYQAGEIKEFVAKHGPLAAAYFEAAYRALYGGGRSAYASYATDPVILRKAFEIVRRLGARDALLLAGLVHRYYDRSLIDATA